jgi:hypothetical protein
MESTRAKTLIFPAASFLIANCPNGVTIDFLKGKLPSGSRTMMSLASLRRVRNIWVFHTTDIVSKYLRIFVKTISPSGCDNNKYISLSIPCDELTLLGDALPLKWKVVGARL